MDSSVTELIMCVSWLLCVSSSEMARWIAAFSPVSSEDEDETLYNERDG